jgi:hypothetical protein
MDNITKLEVYGVDLKKDIRFYYRRISNHQYSCATVTICVIKLPWQIDAHDAYARGLAICSPQDQFNKKQGRNIALGRAVAAIEKKMSFGVIDVPFLIPEEFEDAFMSTYGPPSFLTEYERAMFKLPEVK